MCITKEATLTVQNNPIIVLGYLEENRDRYPCRGRIASRRCLEQRSDVILDDDCREPLNDPQLKEKEAIKICKKCPIFAQVFPEVVRIVATQLQEGVEKYSSQT